MFISLLTLVLICATNGLEHVNKTVDNANETCWTETVCKSSLPVGNHRTSLAEEFSSHLVFSQEGCPPWMFLNKTSGVCECSDIPYRAVLCDPTIPRTSILDCYCMTYNTELDVLELGICFFGCGHEPDTVYYELPQNLSELNSYTCGKAHRDSTLCSSCVKGFSPLAYSYNMSCMNCTGMTYNWIKYIAAAYIPLTVFLSCGLLQVQRNISLIKRFYNPLPRVSIASEYRNMSLYGSA